jgi:hypothetical protein
MHVQDELLNAGAADNRQVKALFSERGILEYYFA